MNLPLEDADITEARSAETVVNFHRHAAMSQQPKRVVLLQGPVGPFFNNLQKYLSIRSYDVWRICFHPGDLAFSSSHNRIYFQHSLAEWESWFSDFVAAGDIDHIILFGSERNIHCVARKVAAQYGVKVISLEEGYIRPGHITVEHDGNNASSPVAGVMPNNLSASEHKDPILFKGPRFMGLYAATYYILRTAFSVGKQKELFHRKFSVGPDVFYWVRNLSRRVLRKIAKDDRVSTLMNSHPGNYFLIPLQVPTDSQMKKAAKGWNSVNLISATLASFAKTASKEKHLVFKIHPLELGHNNYTKLIKKTAQAFNIADRVHVIDSGALGPLVAHSAGMITINSTSGLSAIYHGVPLLVVGDAIYANKALATCAHGKPDFDTFWKKGFVATERVRHSYLGWLKDATLKEGDFYNATGMNVACQGVLEKLGEETIEQTCKEEVVVS